MSAPGALYDWLGQPPPVRSPHGSRYQAVVGAGNTQREVRERVRQRFAAGPHNAERVLRHDALTEQLLPDTDLTEMDRTMRDVAERMRTDLIAACGTFGALDVLLAQDTADRGGVDPAPVSLSDAMARMRADLTLLRNSVPTLVGAIVLPDCDEDMLKVLREQQRDVGW